MAKVILDPGHGGRDIGDYYENRSEKNDNLLLALRIGRFLELQGVEVAYTRKTDIYLTNKERITMVHEAGAALMLSLHRTRKECYTPGYCLDFIIRENDLKARDAAVAIGGEKNQAGYSTCNFITGRNYRLLNEVSVPAIILCIGYIRTEHENEFYNLNFTAIAETIAAGILKFLLHNTEYNQDLLQEPMSACYGYRVMVGSYRCYDEAAKEQLLLWSLGIVTEIAFHNRRSYVIYTAKRDQLDEAVFLEGRLQRLGYHTIITIV